MVENLIHVMLTEITDNDVFEVQENLYYDGHDTLPSISPNRRVCVFEETVLS